MKRDKVLPTDFAENMTVREAFAMAAMQGLLSDPARNGDWSNYACEAVKGADALIAALNEEPQP